MFCSKCGQKIMDNTNKASGKKAGIIAAIITGVVLLVGGGVAAAFALKNHSNNSSNDSGYFRGSDEEDTEATSTNADERENLATSTSADVSVYGPEFEDKLKDLVIEKGYAKLNSELDNKDPNVSAFNTGIVSVDVDTFDTGVPYMLVFSAEETQDEDAGRFYNLYATLYVYDGGVNEVSSKMIQTIDLDYMYDDYEENAFDAFFYDRESMFDIGHYTTELVGSDYRRKSVRVLKGEGRHIVAYSYSPGFSDEGFPYRDSLVFSIYGFDENGISAEEGMVLYHKEDNDPDTSFFGCYDNNEGADINAVGSKYDNSSELIEVINSKCKELGVSELCINDGSLSFDEFLSGDDILKIYINYSWDEVGEYHDDLYYYYTYEIEDNTEAADGLLLWWRINGALDDTFVTLEGGEPYKSYYDYIQNLEEVEWGYNPTGETIEWNNFQLVDMDEDGVPELFITCKNAALEGIQMYRIVYYSENGLEVYEAQDGVASAGGYRGTIYYLHGTRKLHHYSFDAPYNLPYDWVYSLQDGKEVTVGEGGFYLDYDLLPEDYDYDKIYDYGEWKWNDEVVSEDKFNEYFREAVEDIAGTALNSIDCQTKESILNYLKSK